MTTIADGVNNPFLVQDDGPPPVRSALAVVGVERSELASGVSIDEILERARARLRSDPESATCYGRAVTERELERAAALLDEPRARLVSELIDFRHESFAFGHIPEVAEALGRFRSRLATVERPVAPQLGLIAELLAEGLPAPRAPELAPLSTRKPSLPSLADLVQPLI